MNVIPCKISPLNSMEFHGIRWNIFHGIPWSIRTWISMEFHGVFFMELELSMEFDGVLGHGVPWSIFHGIPWKKSTRTSTMEVDPESV